MSQVFIFMVVFLTGLVVGSFLNCVIYRLNTKESFLFSRSHCPKCHHILKWYDLIPILSFIIVKGKCRYCKKKISWQYPLVEIFTGLIFLLLVTCHLSLVTLIYYIVVSSLLIVIFVYDLKHYIIPDKIIYPVIVIVFLYRILSFGHWSLGFGIFEGLKMPLIVGFSAGGFFFLIWLISRGRWMGFGDVKLGFFMGLFLSWPNILVALFSAFFIGAIIGIGLIIAGKKTLKSQVPFGPFLVTGTFIALFWGQNLINWYINLL